MALQFSFGRNWNSLLALLWTFCPRPQQRLYSPHLPLNAEWQRSGCVLRLSDPVEIARNATDKHTLRGWYTTRSMWSRRNCLRVSKSLQTLETRPRPLAELSDPHVHLGALVEALCRSKCRLVAL